MATVTKDFRIKSGLVVEGANATVDGSDIITEDALTGGTQTNIAVTYDPQSKTVSFVAENGVEDSTTDDLTEGITNIYFTDVRAKESAADLLTGATKTNITITGDENGLTITAENGVADSDTDDLTEGTTNLYYTDARARDAISGNAPISYNSTTGEVSLLIGTGLQESAPGDLEINRTTVDTWYDANGAAAQALSDANDYTDSAVGAIPSAVLSIAGDTGTDSITLTSDTLTFAGGEGVDIAVTNNTVTVSAEVATVGNKGVASFANANFVVTEGAVESKPVTIGTTELNLGETSTSLAGLTNVSSALLTTPEISGNNAQNQIKLTPGTPMTAGTVHVSGATITNLGTPTSDTDAATKLYVDTAVSNLVDGAPELLDTLNELAAAINDDENFSSTITTSIGTKVSKAGDTMTGELVLAADPTQDLAAATKQYVDNELDSYLNSTSGSEGTTILYVQDYVDTAIETGDATATPTYLALDINSVAKQVAATVTSTGSGQDTVYQFDGADYRSAKFLVKIASGTHTQVSEVLLTLDTSNNVAITEYAIVGTNGSLGDVTATYGVIDVVTNGVSLIVNDATTGAEITVMGTLLA